MRAFGKRVPVSAVCRGDHVAVRERAADADGDRLLADRDMQKPRQLAGPEALLDLFLEASDQKHLPEELAQGLLGDAAALFDFRHGRDSTLRAMRLVEHFESGLPRRRQSEGLRLVERFRQLMSTLPDDWQSTRLRLIVANEEDAGRAAALLGPTNPGRRGKVINFAAARRGAGVAPEQIEALLRRLDAERIQGELELAGLEEVPELQDDEHPSLVDAWDAALASLPPDWSDLYAEVELASSDYIEPGALRLSPLNPTRPDARPVFRFRAARTLGYGASPEMVRRCLERLEEAGMRGELRILNVISDSQHAKTQGPVWYAGGKVI
jgi:hypothetical protein